ncbi:uncharacterized protein N7511_008886 [Penicillium nucicola]|uniref:uncharacterized protein n=1 Tax=Penicillium nucicola TaxID=1850975 RepID=UPI00254558A0|nr:uncharacterized protein N7511_008886 [Penicillium nucicola]KAJ5747190.1 hypothetical protein N7511_008886 [Penicillium nucicola]
MGFLLPYELIDHIITFIDEPQVSNNSGEQDKVRLAPYATVSRQWQAVVESHTFSTIRLETLKRLHDLAQVAHNERRRHYIQFIDLVVDLAPYDIEARYEFETDEDKRNNNANFTKTIQLLFKILSSWSLNESQERPGIFLSIEAHSPSDLRRNSPDKIERVSAASLIRRPDLINRRFQESYLKLDKEILNGPQITVVGTLAVYGHCTAGPSYRPIEPVSTAMIASKISRLHDVILRLSDNHEQHPSLRERNRLDFAAGFHHWPSTIRALDLSFDYGIPDNHVAILPQGGLEGNLDPLQINSRVFSSRLTRITLSKITIGKELFLSQVVDAETEPLWPNLISFELNYAIASPSGEWLFQRHPGDRRLLDSDNEADEGGASRPAHLEIIEACDYDTHFRYKPIPKFFNEFYIAAARAAMRMPKLGLMHLETGEWPGRHYFKYEVRDVAKATWADIFCFQPNDKVLDLWQQVALQHTGKALETEFSECSSE